MIDWLLGIIAAVFVLCYWNAITQFFKLILLFLLGLWLGLMFIFFATVLFVCGLFKGRSK